LSLFVVTRLANLSGAGTAGTQSARNAGRRDRVDVGQRCNSRGALNRLRPSAKIHVLPTAHNCPGGRRFSKVQSSAGLFLLPAKADERAGVLAGGVRRTEKAARAGTADQRLTALGERRQDGSAQTRRPPGEQSDSRRIRYPPRPVPLHIGATGTLSPICIINL
jgi:hypothetical protein